MFNWFGGDKEVLKATINELEDKVKRLKDAITIKEESYDRLKLKKELEEKEIEHLVRMKEEKNELELERRKCELEGDFNKKEMEMQREYHEKVLKTIAKAQEDSKQLYTSIMKRLPDVTMSIEKRV